MFKKNAAVTGFPIGHFIQTADGAAKTTGTPTCKRLLDGTAGTLTNAASYDATAGVWKIDLAAGDMDGDMVGLVFSLADCIPISYAIRTSTSLVSDVETDTADIQNRLPAALVSGRIAADAQAISGDTTAADNLETMLDGTGGQTLSLGALNVVANASTPAVTVSNAGTGNAVKLQSQSGHTLYIKQVSDANNSSIQLESAGTGMWIVADNDNGIEITTTGTNATGVLINSYQQALVLTSETGEAIHISTNVSNKPAVYIYHYGANPGPAVKLQSTKSAGLEVLGTTPAPDILLSGTGNLTAILSGLGANAITAAAIADDAGTEIAGAVRSELAVELAHLDDDVSSRLAEVDYTPPPSVVDVAAAIMESAYNGYVEGSFGNVSEWVPTSQSNAAAVRAELATELAHLDEDVSAGAHAGDAMALVDDAITAAKFDQSTAHPLAQADTGSTAVARTGADGDTLKALSDEIAGIEAGTGLTAQETADAVHNLAPAGTPAAGSVGDKLNDLPATILITAVAAYANTPGTFGYLLSLLAGLDFTAVNLVATSHAGEITIKRTLTLAAVVSGLTIPADWTACYWTVKRSLDDADADALVQILVSNPPDAEDGLLVLSGAVAEDNSAGSLAVNQALGTVTIALDDASTAALEDAVELVWDVKIHSATAKTQPGAGTATITTAVTRT